MIQNLNMKESSIGDIEICKCFFTNLYKGRNQQHKI